MDLHIVEYIARLARIEVTEPEKEALRPQLSRILEYIDQLNVLSVEGIEPTKEPFLRENVFREDIAKNSERAEDILKNAPAVTDNHFRIPKVIG
ncbi:MAG: Asp-tRNA(Asn)/Glu-tRNA(Gln) amidotransferase subunit GatC [Candidatus Omnitrophica bacterium]|nr:Asp-tRNA(Asn)/Glu-tRNA(Gln) amidotransferase subunit GatC [Candidatus Omnitrophota bacterium]